MDSIYWRGFLGLDTGLLGGDTQLGYLAGLLGFDTLYLATILGSDTILGLAQGLGYSAGLIGWDGYSHSPLQLVIA